MAGTEAGTKGKKDKQPGNAEDSANKAPGNGEAVVKASRKHLTFNERLARSMKLQVEMRDKAELHMAETAKAVREATAAHKEAVANFDKLDRIVKAQESATAPTDESKSQDDESKSQDADKVLA